MNHVAEKTFDSEKIADAYETVLASVCKPNRKVTPAVLETAR